MAVRHGNPRVETACPDLESRRSEVENLWSMNRQIWVAMAETNAGTADGGCPALTRLPPVTSLPALGKCEQSCAALRQEQSLDCSERGWQPRKSPTSISANFKRKHLLFTLESSHHRLVGLATSPSWRPIFRPKSGVKITRHCHFNTAPNESDVKRQGIRLEGTSFSHCLKVPLSAL